ncbi:MAG: GreA/GreB family elongation factor [Planctomycetes bacterium]|nr:GreA/GreB family elongation factor [Planctomycetota bacterium]
MGNSQGPLAELARRAEYKALEDRWLALMDQPAQQRDRGDLLETLELLTKYNKGELAATLGWSWLATEKEVTKPVEALALGRELLLRCGESAELRQDALGLYREVYADRPEIDKLIEASGLGGEKSPRRALRTLEICLNLKPGDFLLSRMDERAAEVVTVDADGPKYTIRHKRAEETLDPDTLALKYDLVEPSDFRALAQLHPGRIAELLASDPAALVVGLLHGHHGKLDSDELKHILSPRYLPAEKWSSWWSKARAALNRSPNVVIEGRNPVMIIYHHTEQTLDDEIRPQWAEADTPAKRLAVLDTYLREAKARGTTPTPELIGRMHRDLLTRVDAARKGSPPEALVEALVIDRLATANLLGPNQADPVRQIVRENQDLPALLRPIEDARFYLMAIAHVRELHPDRWPDIYLELLPHAPVDGCEAIAEALTAAGQTDRLRAVAERIVPDFTGYLGAVCWLWRGKLGAAILPIPAREMLLRLLEHLGRVTRDDYVEAKVLRDTRTMIRAALSAANYSRFRQVIQEMESGLASTIRTTIDRLDVLGHVVRGNLVKIIHETHPELDTPRTRQPVDPWTDDSVIYCTQKGFDRRQEEVNHLTRVKIPENARAIGEAASHGDLSENSEYKFALEERDLLQARLMKMHNELSMARLISAGSVSSDEVNIGTRVTLVDVDGGERREVSILGPFEADMDRGIYNYRAPLCGRLRGLRVSDTVRLDLGAGERDYRVEAIGNAIGK